MKWQNMDYTKFISEAKKICKNRVFTSQILRYAYGTDASCYSYTPEVVIKVANESEVVEILKLAKICKTPVTFKAAGTSLSGQCSSEHVLIIANDGWKNIKINEDVSVIECDCGVIGSDANEALSAYLKKIGPDPATITTALIAGIFNNNSSGMCCGVHENSYNTIHSIRVILHDGTILDTADRQSLDSFCETHKPLVDKLLELRQKILNDNELSELISRKFKIKNTTGYSINALLDFSEINDILNHLFVGAEGTLGFVSKVRYFCVKDYKFKSSGLLFFESLNSASTAVVRLANLPRDVICSAEMMDFACLNAVKDIDGVPAIVKECKPGYTCILIQTQSDSEEKLEANLDRIKAEIKDISMPFEALFTKDETTQTNWWKIRKGILPIVGGTRKAGTTVITEDICFPIEKFCDGAVFLQNLFEKYDFKDGVVFGHALSGNLHFNITPDLNNPKDYENFANLVKEMSEETAKMGGSTKAEHGTGRMVAPFVEIEWGKKAYEINVEIKKVFDPAGFINPDVIITNDPEIYKKNLKSMPSEIVNLPNESELVNKCIECGFCEKHCPSRNLTLTPRQRIAVLREISRLIAKGENEKANLLLKDYAYFGEETCAACSRCYELCPVGIDTAKVANELRKAASAKTLNFATKIYENFENVQNFAKTGMKLYSFGSAILGVNGVSKLTQGLRKISKFMPYTPPKMPEANNYKLENFGNFEQKVIYFSACTNRMFKPKGKEPLQKVVEKICQKAGISVIYPAELNDLCCGKMFVNYEILIEKTKARLAEILLRESQNGEIPIIVDHSSCFYQLATTLNDPRLKILDISEFLWEISPKLKFRKLDKKVLIHKLCLLKKIKKADFIEKVARLCSDKVSMIKSFECCAFAGNKGFFTPELNQSSTKYLKFEATNFDVGVSTSSTCEIGLNSYSNIDFNNIAYLVDLATE